MISSIRSARSAAVEFHQVGGGAEGHGEEVARVVGEAVEDQVGQLAAMDDERLGVVAELGQVREDVAALGQARRLDVFHPPIGVQVFHVARAGLAGGAGMSKPGLGVVTGRANPLDEP